MFACSVSHQDNISCRLAETHGDCNIEMANIPPMCTLNRKFGLQALS
jgi:hypothetical protein